MPLLFFYAPIEHNKIIGMKWFNHFVSNALFLYSLKTSENLVAFWCFQGVEKECIGIEWAKKGTTNLLTRKKKVLFSGRR